MTAQTEGKATTKNKGAKALIDHLECGGGGCKGCRNTGTEMVVRHAPPAKFTVRQDAEGFEQDREDCPCYEGFKINDGVNQCTHPENRAAANWCEPRLCPLLTSGAKTP